MGSDFRFWMEISGAMIERRDNMQRYRNSDNGALMARFSIDGRAAFGVDLHDSDRDYIALNIF